MTPTSAGPHVLNRKRPAQEDVVMKEPEEVDNEEEEEKEEEDDKDNEDDDDSLLDDDGADGMKDIHGGKKQSDIG
jgi:hypothetical protein